MNEPAPESAPTERSLPGKFTATFLGLTIKGEDLGDATRQAQAIANNYGRRGENYRISILKPDGTEWPILIVAEVAKQSFRDGVWPLCSSLR